MHADWIDLLRLLNENNAKYLVVGGYAVAFYGFERYTKDLDIWVARDKKNAMAVIEALATFGAERKSLKIKDFQNPKKVIVLGVEPFRVDFIMGLDALDFETAWPDRVTRENNGVKITYVSPEHLVVLKKAAGRFVDKRDIEALGFSDFAKNLSIPKPSSKKIRKQKKSNPKKI